MVNVFARAHFGSMKLSALSVTNRFQIVCNAAQMEKNATNARVTIANHPKTKESAFALITSTMIKAANAHFVIPTKIVSIAKRQILPTVLNAMYRNNGKKRRKPESVCVKMVTLTNQGSVIYVLTKFQAVLPATKTKSVSPAKMSRTLTLILLKENASV